MLHNKFLIGWLTYRHLFRYSLLGTINFVVVHTCNYDFTRFTVSSLGSVFISYSAISCMSLPHARHSRRF